MLYDQTFTFFRTLVQFDVVFGNRFDKILEGFLKL